MYLVLITPAYVHAPFLVQRVHAPIKLHSSQLTLLTRQCNTPHAHNPHPLLLTTHHVAHQAEAESSPDHHHPHHQHAQANGKPRATASSSDDDEFDYAFHGAAREGPNHLEVRNKGGCYLMPEGKLWTQAA